MKLVSNLQFNGNQAIGIILQHLATDPGSPAAGQAWFNTTQNRIKYFDGSIVHTLAQTSEGVLTGVLGDSPIVATDNADGTFTISIELATSTDPGAMSAADKAKLDTAPSDIGAALDGKIDESREAQADGIATLDGSGKLPLTQLPDAAIGGLSYQGTWDADANSPALSDGSGSVAGEFYRVSVAGTTALDGISDWAVGDWVIFDGTDWQKIDNTDLVSSVNGQTGVVVLTAAGLGALVASQNLSDLTDASTARDNLGLGSAAVLDAPATGDAASGEVVLGSDSRLVPALRFSANVGDGSATQYDITHSLGTRDVVVQVREAASPWAQVLVDVEMLSTTQVRLKFASAPATNQYRVTVLA